MPLVFTVTPNTDVWIGDDIHITFSEGQGFGRLRMAIDAPKDVKADRGSVRAAKIATAKHKADLGRT